MKITIHNLNHEGDGVGHLNGKAVFVAGTLPDEQVEIKISQSKKRFDIGQLLNIEQSSLQRVMPACVDYQQCGGCSWQHVAADAQIEYKQQIWLNQLQRLGRVQPETILPAVTGALWRYRSRARFAWDGKVLGFRQRQSHAVVHPRDCLILPEVVAAALADLQAILRRESAFITKVDVSVGAKVIVWRIGSKKRLSAANYAAFATKCSEKSALPHQVILEDETGQRFLPAEAPPLSYCVGETEYFYQADDFTQIHSEINAQMVQLALEALAPQTGDQILDAFGGLGNFSFPLAERGAEVLLLEGDAAMTARAQQEALRRGLNIKTRCLDLFKITAREAEALRSYRKWLLDPPRAGAQALAEHCGRAQPEILLYVSCDAGTLARDAALICAQGYVYESGRVLNMFPQTAHVESLNVFRRV